MSGGLLGKDAPLIEDVASPMLVQLGGQPEAQSTTCVRGKSRISCRISLQNMGVIKSD